MSHDKNNKECARNVTDNEYINKYKPFLGEPDCTCPLEATHDEECKGGYDSLLGIEIACTCKQHEFASGHDRRNKECAQHCRIIFDEEAKCEGSHSLKDCTCTKVVEHEEGCASQFLQPSLTSKREYYACTCTPKAEQPYVMETVGDLKRAVDATVKAVQEADKGEHIKNNPKCWKTICEAGDECKMHPCSCPAPDNWKEKLREEWKRFCKPLYGKQISAVGEIEAFDWWLSCMDDALEAALTAQAADNERELKKAENRGFQRGMAEILRAYRDGELDDKVISPESARYDAGLIANRSTPRSYHCRDEKAV